MLLNPTGNTQQDVESDGSSNLCKGSVNFSVCIKYMRWKAHFYREVYLLITIICDQNVRQFRMMHFFL